MRLAIRIAAALVGVVTALNVALGLMRDPNFIVPDYLLAAILIGGAIIPGWPRAAPILLTGSAFATGVFSVAASTYVTAGNPVTPGLLIALLVSAAIMVWLARRPAAA